jgi:hypothetical protein
LITEVEDVLFSDIINVFIKDEFYAEEQTIHDGDRDAACTTSQFNLYTDTPEAK